MVNKKVPVEQQAWIEVKKRHRLSHMHIQMAKELGMDPKSFGKLDSPKKEHWKAPLPQYIEKLYMKRFSRPSPEVALAFEQLNKLKTQRRHFS